MYGACKRQTFRTCLVRVEPLGFDVNGDFHAFLSALCSFSMCCASDRWNDLEWGFNNTGQFQNMEQIYQSIVYGGDRGNTQILPGDFTYEDVLKLSIKIFEKLIAV